MQEEIADILLAETWLHHLMENKKNTGEGSSKILHFLCMWRSPPHLPEQKRH